MLSGSTSFANVFCCIDILHQVNLKIFLILLFSTACSQTHFSLPNNVWRVSIKQTGGIGNWKGASGYSGVGPQYFNLDGYGRRYYDHLHPNAYYDLQHLDSLSIGSTTFGDLIEGFNRSSTAVFWGDTLPEFRTVFFGPDSVIIGGYLYNPKLRHTISRQDFKLEYGISNRVTFSFEIPYFQSLEEERKWSWQGIAADGLPEFISYHDSARQSFEDFASHFEIFPINADTLEDLLDIQKRLYTWDGINSVLWALAGGTDPLQTGIVGSAYNPFTELIDGSTTIDSLIAWYLPTGRNASGLGDVTMKLTVLLAGKPAWSQQSYYSAYVGVAVQLPLGRKLSRFNSADTAANNVPSQFSEIQFGSGVTKWTISFFGEFYTFLMNRRMNVNWFTDLGISNREFQNFPVSMLGTNMTHPDSIIAKYGNQYGYWPGWEWSGKIAVNAEIWPDRLWLRPVVQAKFKTRDQFYSVDGNWADFMQYRSMSGKIVYDTRMVQITPSISLLLRNLHPLKKIGPVPFEIEIGGSKPFFTRHAFSDYSIWIGLTTYFQSW